MLSGGVDHVDIRREFAGVVTKVASDVTNLRIGDAVCGICNDSFSTFQTVPSNICQKISAYSQEVRLASKRCKLFLMMDRISKLWHQYLSHIQQHTMRS